MTRTRSEVDNDLRAVDERIDKIRGESRSLFTASEAAGTMTAGQREAIDRYKTGAEKAIAERDALRAERDELRRDYIRSVAALPHHTDEVADDGEPRSGRERSVTSALTTTRADYESAALRAIERVPMAPTAQDRLDSLVRDERHGGLAARYLSAVADDDYKSAFGKLLQYGDGASLRMTREEQAAVQEVIAADSARALSLTGASGGFAVPFELDPSIVPTGAGSINPLRAISRVVTIAGDEWRGVTSAGITAAYAAEATETTDNAPTLVQPTISTEKAQAFVPLSIEVGMDWENIQAELAALLADAKNDLEALKFTVGNGTNEPFGVITGATTTVNATAGGVFDAEDVIRLTDALPARHQARASYVGSGTIINRMAMFETTGGALQFPEVRDGRLLRKPLHDNSSMAIVTTVGALFLIYGDFSRYVIVDRIGLSVEIIQHLVGTNHRPAGQRGLYAFWRNGAKVIDAGAFRVLIGLA